MPPKEVQKIIDEAIEGIVSAVEAVDTVISEAVKKAAPEGATKVPASPNKFHLGQTVAYKDSTCMVIETALTRTNKVLYTLIDDYDVVSDNVKEDELEA